MSSYARAKAWAAIAALELLTVKGAGDGRGVKEALELLHSAIAEEPDAVSPEMAQRALRAAGILVEDAALRLAALRSSLERMSASGTSAAGHVLDEQE